MKKFDLIVIGYGSGDGVAVGAAEAGYSVAVVEEGPLGGTCLNRGCIPSKMLIHVAEVVEEIKQSKKFHVHSKITKIDFSKIVKEVNTLVNSDSKAIEEGVRSTKNMTLYKEKGVFVGFKTLLVGKDTITADKIVLAMGSRPFFPPIEGLREAGFITSDEALNLKKLPKSMAVLGGGYIGSELAFFFSQMGCKVTIIDRNEFLLKNEDEEVSKEFTRAFSKKINFLNNTSVKKVSKRKGKKILSLIQGTSLKKLVVEEILVATGRTPNAELTNVKQTSVRLDKHGFVKTNAFMETNVPGIFALGDVVGKYAFKHSANLEAEVCLQNLFAKKKKKVNYKAMPHAVFSSPQIAGVGLTEQQARLLKKNFVVGKYYYSHTGMGAALKEENGFVKFVVDEKTDKILGCHIIGPHASTLIHEVLVVMRKGNGKITSITDTVHIHPALSEVVERAGLNT